MKIPTGKFGNAVAAPQQAANIPAGAADVATAREVQGLGAQVGGIGQELLDTQRRAQDIRRMADTEGALSALQDEIGQGLQAGVIDPTKAHGLYGEKAKQIISSQVGNVGPLYRDAVQAQLEGAAMRVGGRVRDMATRQVQQNIGGELTALGNALEREPDPKLASQRYNDAVRAMGPAAGMTPAQIESSTNTFREKAYSTKAYTMLSAARNDMGALNKVQEALSSDEFAALDPQRRAQLIAQADGYKVSLEQRAVAAAQREEIRAQARERKAGQLVNGVYKLAIDGKKIDPEYAAEVTQAAAGTAYESMLPGILKAAPEGTAFATQPTAQRVAILQQLTAQGNRDGWTPESSQRFENLQKSHDAALRDAQADPLTAAAERGVILNVTPLDMSGGMATLMQGLQSRTMQAASVETWTGRPTSPFTADEAPQVATFLTSLPPDQRASALADMQQMVGPRVMGAIATQINSKDRALGLSAGLGDLRMADGGLLSQQLLRGDQAIKDKRVPESDLNRWRADIAKEVRGTMASPVVEDAAIDAAVLLQASGQAGGNRMNSREAVAAVAGEIVERNGSRIPLPRGMSSSDFNSALKAPSPGMILTPTPDGFVYSSGNKIPISKFLGGLRDAPLRHAGQGLYTVSAGAGSVLNENGQPVLITVSSAPALPPAKDAKPAGLVERGNINLNNRPVVKNSDGTISTVRSMSFEEDDREVLVPTVSDDGRIMSDDEAIQTYRKTGRHLGKFNNPQDADRYAEQLHLQQEAQYGSR
ncbi:hypothetical protein [Xylophilus sp.]|uniref:hypothetical protein n=1 Tax=Xylophilus sp. TaxID=2653893 RepID=UPI0013B8EAF3|nr:hypothetical protein [Xylophilus sp.]KAF1041782.1 MAG: hypothetical protein GAK38_04505 [Xylophilus sp.]